MAASDRVYWDSVYREALKVIESYPAPDPLLFMYTPPFTGSAEPPLALDLACGLGQNGLWLAGQGYIVDLVDISRVALVAAQQEAANRGLRAVNFLQFNLETASREGHFPPLKYDLICVFRYFNRDLFRQLRTSLKPGGRIIGEVWNTNYLAIDPSIPRDQLVEVGELSGMFADWQLLRNTDNGSVSQVVAIKPV